MRHFILLVALVLAGFDSQNVVGGYYLLPQSSPAGLYNRKPDNCSRGNKLLIDVIPVEHDAA